MGQNSYAWEVPDRAVLRQIFAGVVPRVKEEIDVKIERKQIFRRISHLIQVIKERVSFIIRKRGST